MSIMLQMLSKGLYVPCVSCTQYLRIACYVHKPLTHQLPWDTNILEIQRFVTQRSNGAYDSCGTRQHLKTF